MRAEDRRVLKARYTALNLGHYEFAEPLGVHLSNTQKLYSLLFASLDEENYGIGWWQCYTDLDFKRRILISDQLIQSLQAIQVNCIEARLSASSFFDGWDKQNQMIKNGIKIINGKPIFQYPERVSRLDDLPSYMTDLHLKGFLSSVCSAVDCLAAVCVGVMGLRTSLIKVGYPSLLNHLRDRTDFAYANSKQQELLERLQALENDAGPEKWLNWLFDFRNMSVHRGRRISFSQIFPHPSSTYKKPLARAVPMLVTNPAVSEIESLKDGSHEMLSESAEDSINASLKSCILFIESVVEYLTIVWNERIENPDLISQPKDQWKTIRNGDFNSFRGYNPNSISTAISQVTMHPSNIKRMRSAALDSKDINKWR